MSIQTSDLKPGDVFKDEEGGVWIVLHWCNEPTVKMRQVWPPPPPPDAGIPWLAREQGGGVNGLMWNGFVKLEPPNG